MIEILGQPHVLEILGVVTILFTLTVLGLLKAGIFTLNGKRCDSKCPDPECRTCVVATAETVRILYEGQREIRDEVRELNKSVAIIETEVSFLVKNAKGE